MGRYYSNFKEDIMRILSSLRLVLPLTLLILATACTRPPEPPPTVLFDQGHGQHFVIGNNGELDLSKLAGVFRDQGWEVKSANKPFTADLLRNAHALIISGAFKRLTPQEIAVLKDYLNNGGQIAIMLHIGSPVARLLNALGIAVSNGVIRERGNLIQDNPTDFLIKDLSAHPLTKGVESIAFYGTWAIDAPLPANSIARTLPGAWIDLNGNKTFDKPVFQEFNGRKRQVSGDVTQAFTVIATGQVGRGQFVVFGDDAIFQNRFLTGSNEQLARNLATWFK